MLLQPPNQSFMQYTWYLVILNDHLFCRPLQQLILTKNVHQYPIHPSLSASRTCIATLSTVETSWVRRLGDDIDVSQKHGADALRSSGARLRIHPR